MSVTMALAVQPLPVPCLPACGSYRELSGLDRHAPGCPNAPADMDLHGVELAP